MTTGNNSISNGFSWALLEIKSGNKVARSGWDNAEGYLAITKDEGDKFISLVYQDGGYKKWQETHEDLLAEDWISYSEEIEPRRKKFIISKEW
ncbi:MW1434 family type I TA system toxin [Kalamiella sp. sgz302252]|uniref:Thoeris anti-defense Tad2 family protein n=1 Tax=Pantoea sp. sgz302252 TaxID=3341827 RepID=UPI0036D3D298